MTDHELNLACAQTLGVRLRENLGIGQVQRHVGEYVRYANEWETYDPVNNVEQQNELSLMHGLPLDGIVQRIYGMQDKMLKQRTDKWRENWKAPCTVSP